MMEPVATDRSARLRSHLTALLITTLLFATAFYVSNYFNEKRVADIRGAQDDISTDILSIETQFDLLQTRSCKDVSENTILPGTLSALGSRLSYMEAQTPTSAEVTRLKRLYSLLEIKDYLLMQQIAVKCKLKPVFVLYFYSNKGDCTDCKKQGYVLTALAQKYPQLRIYSFDYNLDVSALQTLIDTFDIRNELPALVIDGTPHYELQKIEDIEKILPQLESLKSASSTKAR